MTVYSLIISSNRDAEHDVLTNQLIEVVKLFTQPNYNTKIQSIPVAKCILVSTDNLELISALKKNIDFRVTVMGNK